MRWIRRCRTKTLYSSTRAAGTGSSRPFLASRRGCARATRGSPRAHRRIDRIGYGAITAGEADAGGAARAANLDARLRQGARAAPRRRADARRGPATRPCAASIGAASRKSNLELLFGEKALDFATSPKRTIYKRAGDDDFPRAAPDEDELSCRCALFWGRHVRAGVRRGRRPADLSGRDDESGRHPLVEARPRQSGGGVVVAVVEVLVYPRPRPAARGRHPGPRTRPAPRPPWHRGNTVRSRAGWSSVLCTVSTSWSCGRPHVLFGAAALMNRLFVDARGGCDKT